MPPAARATPALVTAFAVAALITGCAEPSGSFGDYQSKAQQTARAMVSAIASGQLGAQLLLNGRATQAYADVVVTDAERDANSVETTFDSRQPPDERSIQLKNKVDTPLQNATSALTDLRIAVRRNDARDVRHALDELKKPLAQFQKMAGS